MWWGKRISKIGGLESQAPNGAKPKPNVIMPGPEVRERVCTSTPAHGARQGKGEGGTEQGGDWGGKAKR